MDDAAAFRVPHDVLGVGSASRCAIADLVADLAAARYEALEADGRSGRLTARDLEVGIESFGRTLLPIPEQGWALGQVFELGDGSFSIDLPLWTAEEGRSDLTLSLSLRCGAEGCHVEIDDIHVL